MESLTTAEGRELVAATHILDVETYRVAVGLNNHGVALLQSGDYGNAARLFKQASRIMISAIQDTSHPPESPSQEPFTSPLLNHNNNVSPDKWLNKKPAEEACNLPAFETTSFEAAASSMSCVPVTTAFDSGDSLVFGRPLIMQLPAFDNMDPLQCTSQSSVIVYNLALAFHLYGTMCGGLRGRQMFETALELYDMAARLVWISIQANPALISPVLLVALHNMGWIYRGLGGDQEARECSHQLAIVLRMVRCRDERAGYDYERLCLSLLSFTKSIEAAAAA
jgi:tetratricopeptide (TPR) repeat protein